MAKPGQRSAKPGAAALGRQKTSPAQSRALAVAPPVAPRPIEWLEIPVAVTPDIQGLDALTGESFGTPEDIALAVLAARLRDAESFQRILALERARGLLPFQHQEDTVRKVLSVFLGRALLADEVGLGKTVEAGLVLAELMLRGRVSSALVLVPPSLVGQWREELVAKFGLESRTTEDAELRSNPREFWARQGIVVASLASARSAKHRDAVTEQPWDMLIVDEAHVLKNATTATYRTVSSISSRFLLLLTATPVENRIEELYNLVSLLRPGHLGGRAAFSNASQTRGCAPARQRAERCERCLPR
jgi:SNF2 family DNA or RNA helicase